MKYQLLLLGLLIAWTGRDVQAAPLALNEQQLESLASGFRQLVEAEKSNNYAEIYRLKPEIARETQSLEQFTEEMRATELNGYQLLDLRVLSIERREPELYGIGSIVIRSCGRFRTGSRTVDLLIQTDSYLSDEEWSFEGLLFLSSLDSPPEECSFPDAPSLDPPGGTP